MAPHSSTHAWKIPWTEEPGRLQSMGSRRVWDDWATSLSLFTFMHWRRKWQLTPVFMPGKSHGRRSLVGYSPWGCKESDTAERLLFFTAVFILQLWHPYMTTGKTLCLTRRISFGKVMSLLFNMLSRLVITFLPRSKCLLISWLQSLSAVILELLKNKVCHSFHCFLIYLPWSDGTRCRDLSFMNVLSQLFHSYFHQEAL